MNTPTIHNPENVPQSAVPSGWRFKRKGEKLAKGTPNRLWCGGRWGRVFKFAGLASEHNEKWTYIVPGEPDTPAEATLRDALKAAYEALEQIRDHSYTLQDVHRNRDIAAEALKLLQPHITT